MTAFQRTVICIGIILSFFWIFKWHTPTMKDVYPDDCVYAIDPIFSTTMHAEIKSFIDQAYKKNKSPSGLLLNIENNFGSIKSVIIDMQDPKFLNFLIQAYKPIFLLNNEHVICEQGKIFDQNVFTKHELKKLENVSFDGLPTPKNISRLIKFFGSLQDPLLQDFSVRWMNKHAIWLDQKQGNAQEQDLSLLVGYETAPNNDDIAQCRKLRGQISDKPCKDKRGKPCKNNITWVCDLRFDRQIVLFSTNKGV